MKLAVGKNDDVARVFDGLDQHQRTEMREQLVAEQRHILCFAVETVDDFERLGCVLVNHARREVIEIALVGKTCRGTHDLVADVTADGNAAVEQRERVSERAVGNRGDQHGGAVVERDVLLIRHIEQPVGDGARRNAVEIKPLTARLDGEHDLVDFCCCEDEHDMLWRLLEDFEQCVEGLGGEHMHLVDDIDLVTALVGRALHLVDDAADVVDLAVRGSVHLKYVDGGAVVDLTADLTFAAGTSVLRIETVDSLGKQLGAGGFACAARACEKIGMADAVIFQLIAERRRDMLLSRDVVKGFGTPLSV